MPIPRPVTKTKIATVTWGIPITDAVNKAVDTDIPALQAFDTSIKPTAWVNATLINGWTNFGGYQHAQYRKVGDIVYCRGAIGNGTAVSTVMFNFPAGYRPPLALQFVQPLWAGVGNLTISPAGDINVSSIVAPATTQFVGITIAFSTI